MEEYEPTTEQYEAWLESMYPDIKKAVENKSGKTHTVSRNRAERLKFLEELKQKLGRI